MAWDKTPMLDSNLDFPDTYSVYKAERPCGDLIPGTDSQCSSFVAVLDQNKASVQPSVSQHALIQTILLRIISQAFTGECSDHFSQIYWVL